MKRTKKGTAMLIVMLLITAYFTFGEDLILAGWSAWGGVQAASRGNTVTLNGRITSGGYVNERLNAAAMRGKTVTLEIRNADNSEFSEGRLMKITVNKNDQLVSPSNIPNLVYGEYVPSTAAQVVFTLPNNFDGKIGFVFYQADLKGLQIIATYR